MKGTTVDPVGKRGFSFLQIPESDLPQGRKAKEAGGLFARLATLIVLPVHQGVFLTAGGHHNQAFLGEGGWP